MAVPFEKHHFHSLVQEAMDRHGGSDWSEYIDDPPTINQVAKVEESPPYIVKVPRAPQRDNNINWARELVQAESSALKTVEPRIDDCPVQLPRLIEAVEEGRSHPWPYNVLTYVPGKALTFEQIKALSTEQRIHIGEQLGKFSVWLFGAIGADTAKELGSMHTNGKIIMSDKDRHFLPLLDFDDPALPTVSRFTQMMARRYDQFYPDGINSAAKHAVHGDLRPGNYTFDKNDQLTGVIDFGGIRLGEFQEESRALYYLGKAAVEAYGNVLGSHGLTRASYEHAEFWQVGGWLRGLLEAVEASNYRDIKLYQGYLASTYPDEDWSELSAHWMD